MNPNTEWRRRAGFGCLAASIAVLVFQQSLGQYLGSGVLLLWLGLGALGVWLLGDAGES